MIIKNFKATFFGFVKIVVAKQHRRSTVDHPNFLSIHSYHSSPYLDSM